jgi:hypothetical protein
MKRQQVISRFFTPKPAAAASAPAAPSTSASSPSPTVPRPSSAGDSPLASRAPVSSSSQRRVNGSAISSRGFSEDFSFGSSGKRSSRKRPQDEAEDNADDDPVVEDSRPERTFASGCCLLTLF